MGDDASRLEKFSCVTAKWSGADADGYKVINVVKFLNWNRALRAIAFVL